MALNTLIEKAEEIANDFAHLKIITAVGDFKYAQKADGSGYEVAPGTNNSAMQTDINLAQGDIVNLVAREFTTDALTEMRDFHETQVLNAKDIVKGNIDAVISLAKLVGSVSSDGDDGSE